MTSKFTKDMATAEPKAAYANGRISLERRRIRHSTSSAKARAITAPMAPVSTHNWSH